MSILDSVKEQLSTHVGARQPARIPDEGDGGFVGNEPLKPTPGGSFDTGPTVDDANLEDAGGYPDTTELLDFSDPLRAPDPQRRRRRSIRKWTGGHYTFAANLLHPPLLVTPSGIDARDITEVQVTATAIGLAGPASAPRLVRVGQSSNDAQAGPWLYDLFWAGGVSYSFPGGPLWIVADTTVVAVPVEVSVIVFYEEPVEHDDDHDTPAKPCGCK